MRNGIEALGVEEQTTAIHLDELLPLGLNHEKLMQPLFQSQNIRGRWHGQLNRLTGQVMHGDE